MFHHNVTIHALYSPLLPCSLLSLRTEPINDLLFKLPYSVTRLTHLRYNATLLSSARARGFQLCSHGRPSGRSGESSGNFRLQHQLSTFQNLQEGAKKNAMGTSTENKGHWSSDEMKAGTQDQDLGEVEKDNFTGDERNGLQNGPVPDMDTLEIGITKKEMGELLNYMPSAKHCERKRTSSKCEAEPHVSVVKRSKSKVNSRRKAKELEKQIKVTKKDIEESEEAGSPLETVNLNDDDDMSAKTDESKGKTLLEILELEMRARAIRALLKQQSGPGDGEDVDSCEGDSELRSPCLSTVKDAVGSYNDWSPEDNAAGSNSFDIIPKSIRQKFKQKGMENVPLNQCIVDAEHTNNLYSALSPKLSQDINAITQFCSTQSPELCSPTKTDHTLGTKHSEFNKNLYQVANEDSSQSISLGNIKSEVICCGKTQGTDSMKLGLPLHSNNVDQESGSYAGECKETEMALTPDEPNKEDGELSNDDKSSESVLEIQPDGGCNDIIILDDSDDELLELYTSNKLQKTLVQQTHNSQKLSLENPHEQGNFNNDRSPNVQIHGTLNTALRECLVKAHKPLISYETSGSTSENLAQTEKNVFSSSYTETEGNEHCRPESQNKSSDTTDCSWATRWLQSKDVQKVVSTSKMCAKIRKRMKFAQKGNTISLTRDPEGSCKSSVVIVGSVNEYNMLDKPKCGNCETPEDSSKSSE
ncbi:uncharacterized protein LOC111869871 isoform X2 [Cryptotermes secundus]|uniref:uncharacterized protein LOC111869871 isoform X2 n=1 Tax=Cryptotermes secundus TaxID=105785 RepID=UPI001454CD82|nr:uncharacterized protein LOC111869871 isoform X2 [Cryptotermes secundus]